MHIAAAPTPMHIRPALQVRIAPPQQGWLAAPQAPHIAGVPALQVAPAQQACPLAPQAMQVPTMPPPAPTQANPVSHWAAPAPAQQAAPLAPQAVHIAAAPAAPAVQRAFAPVQVPMPPPAQQ